MVWETRGSAARVPAPRRGLRLVGPGSQENGLARRRAAPTSSPKVTVGLKSHNKRPLVSSRQLRRRRESYTQSDVAQLFSPPRVGSSPRPAASTHRALRAGERSPRAERLQRHGAGRDVGPRGDRSDVLGASVSAAGIFPRSVLLPWAGGEVPVPHTGKLNRKPGAELRFQPPPLGPGRAGER